MKKLVFALAVCVSSVALAQNAAPAPAAPEAPKGPDVTKMPFTADSVKQVVNSHQEQIQSCYERTIAEKEKDVAGKLKTSWTITSEGLVKNARVHSKGSTVKDKDLYQCVEAVLLSMTFPSPGANKEVPIEFPFNLKLVK